MSVETSETNQPGDEEPSHGRHSFFRSADSGADAADVNDDASLRDDDLDDDDVTGDDVTGIDDDNVVRGTVVDEDDAAAAAPATTPGAWDTVDRDADEPDPVVADADEPQPSFTPADDAADVPADDVPAADGYVDPTAPTLNETDNVPVVTDPATDPATGVPVTDTTAAETTAAPVAAVNANEPLLADLVGLRASWQQAQAGFVDDPRAAVADAAELVEHTAQTLIGSLQQRQRQLRDQWENGAGAAGAGELSDTEQLRHLMQDYRSLFNQLVQP